MNSQGADTWTVQRIEREPKLGDWDGYYIRLISPEGNHATVLIKVTGTLQASQGLLDFPFSEPNKLPTFCVWVVEQLVRQATARDERPPSEHMVDNSNIAKLGRLESSVLAKIEETISAGEKYQFRIQRQSRRLGFRQPH